MSFVKHTIALDFDMRLHLIVIKDFLHHYKWLQHDCSKATISTSYYVSLHIKYESFCMSYKYIIMLFCIFLSSVLLFWYIFGDVLQFYYITILTTLNTIITMCISVYAFMSLLLSVAYISPPSNPFPLFIPCVKCDICMVCRVYMLFIKP